MSSYKIYAKKGKKVMPIKLEEKHTYVNVTNDIAIYKPLFNNVTSAYVKGYNVNPQTVHILHNTNNVYIPQGTGESNRIGNKVNIKSISLTMNLSFIPRALIDSFGHGQNIDTCFRFRLMTVKFEQQMTATDISTWFRQSYIYFYNITAQDGAYPVMNNWAKKLRESTPWTGEFSILMDKKFTLTKFKSFKQIVANVPVKGNVNFDNNSSKPTGNQYFSNIYTFLISPSYNKGDMDPISVDKADSLVDDSINLFEARTNIKIIYYDV